ncbi:MAG: hypothetical protein AAGA86_09810, partial [Bacteroidota bacterium]
YSLRVVEDAEPGELSGQRVAHFEGNSLGMGTFFLDVGNNSGYYAMVNPRKEGDSPGRYALPRAEVEGSILAVEKLTDSIRIQATSTTGKGRVFIKASCRGMGQYMIEGPLRDGKLVYIMPANELPEGIIEFRLMDQDRKPVAERLFFNRNKSDSLGITIAADKESYTRREETRLDIKMQVSGGESSAASASALVMKKAHRGENLVETIQSYFLLTSDLRGAIEDPGYYFQEENPERFNDLDALMLTQGWRNYKYPVEQRGIHYFPPEPGLMVRGRARTTFPKNRPLAYQNLTLMTFGKEHTLYTLSTDSLGQFQFLLDDAHGQRMRIFLQAVSSRKKSGKALFLDSLKPPKIAYVRKPEIIRIDPVLESASRARQERLRAQIALDSLFGVTQLDEVVVEGYRISPERKKAYEAYGEPDVIIDGDAIREKEKKWSYGLYSILLFNYGNQIQIEQFPDGFMLAHVVGGKHEATLLAVNGRLLEAYEYEFVPSTSPEIVESVELVKYAKNFRKQYLTVFPEVNPLEAPSQGHIISIYTKNGVGLQGGTKPLPGTLNTTVRVFSPVKEFYAPKYKYPVPISQQKPDLRALLLWEPELEVDPQGKASHTFYNGDVIGEYVIVVEAISGDGRLGYALKTYEVVE